MESNRVRDRRHAHALLDRLSDDQIGAVRNLLEVMIEPLGRSLALAPADDGDVNDEAAAAIGRARDSIARGEGIAHDDILAEFGLNG
jgi:hypothetical protein